ncbi:MAG: GvpL/GvpF family gas vesicle protein [Pseudomonadota bacterium]
MMHLAAITIAAPTYVEGVKTMSVGDFDGHGVAASDGVSTRLEAIEFDSIVRTTLTRMPGIPLPLGMVSGDEHALKQFVHAHNGTINQAIHDLSGTGEYVIDLNDSLEMPHTAKLREKRAYIKAQRTAAKRAEETIELLSQWGEPIIGASQADPSRSKRSTRINLLVRRAFQSCEIEALQNALFGWFSKVTITGPFAPYSAVKRRLEGGTTQ